MSDADAGLADVDPLLSELADAHAALGRARERVAAVGEAELTTLSDRHDALTDLFTRYEERVTGDGDFQTFIEFQGKIAAFTEDLPADTRRRDVFEEVDDLLQQRRLTESDWERVRGALAPVREDVDRLAERGDARDRYRRARRTVQQRRRDLRDRVDDLERLRRLGDADLEAPTERLRDPIERYDDRVTTAFETFYREASARDVLAYLSAAAAFPLVGFEAPPGDLREYVHSHEAGTEPLPGLSEYAGYSRSKLDHYVADPDALKRAVGTRQTYLRRLDADPLTVDWPPPAPGVLRFRCRELTGAVARFADGTDEGEAALVALRAVRALPRETDYERLRDSARARARLSEDERERLASGAVDRELAACRDAIERVEAALAEREA
jgi:hypothetical protein